MKGTRSIWWTAALIVVLCLPVGFGYFAALGDSITSDIILKTSNTGFTNSAYEYTAGGYVVPEEDILHYDGGYSTYSSKPVPVNVLGDEELMAISGYVFDSAGNPLAGVPVELEDEGWTMWLEDTTDGEGYFEFTGLAEGLYELYINEEGGGEADCSVKDEVTECHDIGNEADCENSYAEYCSGDCYYCCGLSEGECGYFPCFWGDVGEGHEACYFSCDECMFGINQSFSEGYTSINFEDENAINLTEDLEINATLLKMDAKLELNSSAYQNGDVIKANVTVKNNEAFNLINWAAVFGVWGENDEDEELYFNLTPTNLLAGQTRSYIFTYRIPENNTYDELYVFGGAGNLNWNVPSSQGILAALIYKTDEREIRIGDSDGDGINDNVDNCPSHYNPHQGNIIYVYDNFNDNSLSPDWNIWSGDPAIAIRETNQEIRIDGTTTQQGWNTLQFNQNFNQDVEASIRVRTPVIDEGSAFSFIIRNWDGGYYRIHRHYWGYNVGGHLAGEDYWDSGVWSGLIGDEETNFHTYKIVYEKSKQNMSFFVDNFHLLTIENVNFNDFRFGFVGEGWQAGADMDFRIDNFTVREMGDFDSDNIGDVCDNCPYDYNPGQEYICGPVTVSGYVFDADNNPLTDITVELEDFSENELLTSTDAQGYYEFSGVPKGYYELEVNDEEPIIWSYTGAGIGDDTPMLDATSDIQVNFTLLRVDLSFETNASSYDKGDTIEVDITVTNNEILYDLQDWEMGAELYFENDTYFEFIDEDFYYVNVSPGETKSLLVYIQIPEDTGYDNLYLEGFIWTDEARFSSSKGLLRGEMWQWQEMEIHIGEFELTGDVNGDCIVNIFDLAHVGLCYGKQPVGFCDTADIHPPPNGNGVINIFDLATVGLNYGGMC